MNESLPGFWPIFFDLFESLPRQGPGSRACAERALGLCRGVPPKPEVLDLGCGTGGQTLQLAELTGGRIVAVDTHAPSIERLKETVAKRGLSNRVRPIVADMAEPGLSPASFDLIWSEGALYNIGIENALRLCRGLLKPGGFLAFTDAVWLRDDPPPEVAASFADYPSMGRVADILAIVESCGLELLGHFTLPEDAWWDDFYTPMERRIEEMRGEYAGDAKALAVLDELAKEPWMRRRWPGYYGYEFFLTRRP